MSTHDSNDEKDWGSIGGQLAAAAGRRLGTTDDGREICWFPAKNDGDGQIVVRERDGGLQREAERFDDVTPEEFRAFVESEVDETSVEWTDEVAR